MPGSQTGWPLGVTLAYRFLDHVMDVGVGPPPLACLALVAHPRNRISLRRHVGNYISLSGWEANIYDNPCSLSTIIAHMRAIHPAYRYILYRDFSSASFVPDHIVRYLISIRDVDSLHALRNVVQLQRVENMISSLTFTRFPYEPHDGFIPYRHGSLVEMIEVLQITGQHILEVPVNDVGYKIMTHLLATDKSINLGSFLVERYKDMIRSNGDQLELLTQTIAKLDWSHVDDKILFHLYILRDDYITTFDQLLESHIFDPRRGSPPDRFRRNFNDSNKPRCLALYAKMRDKFEIDDALTRLMCQSLIISSARLWRRFLDLLSMDEKMRCINHVKFVLLIRNLSAWLPNITSLTDIMTSDTRRRLVMKILEQLNWPDYSSKDVRSFLNMFADVISVNIEGVIGLLTSHVQSNYPHICHDKNYVRVIKHLVSNSDRFGVTDRVDDQIIGAAFNPGTINAAGYFMVKDIALSVWGWEQDEFNLYMLKLSLRRGLGMVNSFFAIDKHALCHDLEVYTLENGSRYGLDQLSLDKLFTINRWRARYAP